MLNSAQIVLCPVNMPLLVFEHSSLSNTQDAFHAYLVFSPSHFPLVYFQVCAIHIHVHVFSFSACFIFAKMLLCIPTTHNLDIVLCLIFLHCIPFYESTIVYLTSLLLMGI